MGARPTVAQATLHKLCSVGGPCQCPMALGSAAPLGARGRRGCKGPVLPLAVAQVGVLPHKPKAELPATIVVEITPELATFGGGNFFSVLCRALANTGHVQLAIEKS